MAANLQVVVVPPTPARNLVDQSIAWIGFGTEVNRNNIRDEGGLEAFDDFFGFTMINIQDMASGFSNRTIAKRRINFGMWRVKYTLGIMHWAQDETRRPCTSSLTGISDAKEYKDLLDIALYRGMIRKVEADQADTISKAADTETFKDERT